MADEQRSINDLVFVGLNKRVAALDRYTGDFVWEWRAAKGSGFVNLLLDGDRLIVATGGYVYCIDPLFGQQVWANALRGFGHGVAGLASVQGVANQTPAAAAMIQQQQQAAAAGGAGGAAAAG